MNKNPIFKSETDEARLTSLEVVARRSTEAIPGQQCPACGQPIKPEPKSSTERSRAYRERSKK